MRRMRRVYGEDGYRADRERVGNGLAVYPVYVDRRRAIDARKRTEAIEVC